MFYSYKNLPKSVYGIIKLIASLTYFMVVLYLISYALAYTEGSVKFPQELFYKGEIILPDCIGDRTSDIIDLDECRDNLTKVGRNHLPKIDGKKWITDDTAKISYFDYMDNGIVASGEEYIIKYLGVIDGHMLLLGSYSSYNGRSFFDFETEIISFKRAGNKLIIDKVLASAPEDHLTQDAYIKDGVLYFSAFLEIYSMWDVIRAGAINENSKFKDMVSIVFGARGYDMFCGVGFFHLKNLVVDSTKPHNFLFPTIPDSIKICDGKGSIDSKGRLKAYQPGYVFRNENKVSELPYYETFFEYCEKGKTTLSGKDYVEFVDSVILKSNEMKKNQALYIGPFE